MVSSRSILVTAGLAFILQSALAAEISLTIHPDREVNRIDEKVYGHFLEHIYHSVNGGLWGDLVWNRSFEQNAMGNWAAADNCVVQEGLGTNQRLTFGSADWTDYEFTVEAQKTAGSEGFLILFRCKTEDDFYWCNLGGWGNVFHQLERGRKGEGRWHGVGPRIEGSIEAGPWYRIRVRCQGAHIQVSLDGKEIIDFTDPDGHVSGKVGIGTWATQAKYRNLKVTSLTGEVLFEGLPDTLLNEKRGAALDQVRPGKSVDRCRSCGQQQVQSTGDRHDRRNGDRTIAPCVAEGRNLCRVVVPAWPSARRSDRATQDRHHHGRVAETCSARRSMAGVSVGAVLERRCRSGETAGGTSRSR